MGEITEINRGEVKVKFTKPTSGKISFEKLGLDEGSINTSGGFLRIVFDFEGIGEHNFFKMPTIHLAYNKDVKDTHWVCDFNRVTILDKTDHFGHSTVILLNRNKISELEHHHENKLILHAEFPTDVELIAKDSYVNFFV